MVSIAHWLDTFTCSKYADRFERSGYQSLQSVCQLTTAQLQTLGIAHNDIYIIMENVSLLKQSLKSLEPPRYLDLNSEPPSSTARSRTASPAINSLNRNMSQNPSAYSPRANVSTPPASSGPSPDRGLTGPSNFDTPPAYHRSNSYSNPVNPNTFLDISPSSSTSSPHRSTSIDAYPQPMEPTQYNEYPPQSQPPPMQPHPHQFQPPGMMYRSNMGPGPGPAPPGYYNPPPARYYSPEQQQQFMYANQRMMMHPPQQHSPWAGHRPPLPPPPQSHPMHYHPYDHQQYRMQTSQPMYHPNHPMMSDQNQMFLNQHQHQHQQQQQQQTTNPSTSTKLSNTGEPHPHPLQSLERLVLLPESQVIDPKSVVNEIHDPQSPFSESLSPYGTSSPKNSVATPPTATIVSNLLTNEKSILEQHTKGSSGLKRSSMHDDRNDLNKKNRMNASNDLNTGDSIINNHPVVTSLLTRGLNNSAPQAPLPSIKSLQQKHNPSFLQQQQQQQQQPMLFSQNQPDPQQFVDGSNDDGFELDETIDISERDYENLIAQLRTTIENTRKHTKVMSSKIMKIASQLDGLSETEDATPKSTGRTSRKRPLSKSLEQGIINSENQSASSVKSHLNKSNSDPSPSSSSNGPEKKRNGSVDNHSQKSPERRLSETNFEINQSSKSPSSPSISPQIQKPKVIQSPTPSNLDQESNSSNDSTSGKNNNDDEHPSSKPVREAKKRSLIYTGNTREFLETAIAAGLIDANDEDEDNEYVPPGGKIPVRSTHSSTSSDNDDESDKGTDNEEEDEDEVTENDDEENRTENEPMEIEQPSESGIRWNVRNRPARQTHLIRFNNISKEDEQKFFGALQEQIPELAAYLNEDSDDEYQEENKEATESTAKPVRKSSTKKTQRREQQQKDSSEQDEQTVEIIKKFRHVNVPSEKRTRKKSQNNASTTISVKNRSDELYVVLNDNGPRTIISGTQLENNDRGKKSTPVQSFHFHRRPVKINTVEDLKAPWRCIFCWKEPYEDYLGPLFGAYPLNDQCLTYLNTNKQLGKHYRKLKEVWFHRDCALWNNHIQMNANTGELMHVSEACSTYLDITCSICQLPGATLACRHRNCKIRYHYPCAKTTIQCRLIPQSYSIYCPKHNQINKTKKSSRPTTSNLNDSKESSMI